MKMVRYLRLVLMVVVVSSLASCERKYDFGFPEPKIDGIIGKWVATKVELVDPEALSQGKSLVRIDITDAYDLKLDTYTVTFSGIKEGPTYKPGSFEIASNGAYNFIEIFRGTWKFDNMTYPTKVLLQASEPFDDVVPPNANFRLIAPPRKGTPLRLSFDRVFDNKVLCSYVYSFEKVEEKQ